MTQATLVETCRHNLQTSLLPQIGVAESHSWKQLIQQGEQAEAIIARVKIEENKPRLEKSTRRTPEVSFQSKRKDTLATEAKSPVKPQPTRGGSSSSSQPCANRQYSFKDEYVDSLFKLLNKNKRLKLFVARHPEEVGKTDNPKYCLYHGMPGHPTKSCTSSKTSFKFWLMQRCLSSAQSRRKWQPTWRHFFSSRYNLQHQQE